MGSSVHWKWPRKESVSLKMCQQKVPKLKSKEEKWNRISNNYVTNIKSATYVQREEQEKEKRRKEMMNNG